MPKKYTIDDLLNSLQSPNPNKTLENSRETWRRINQNDPFDELGLNRSELDEFLKDWIHDNPYSALK